MGKGEQTREKILASSAQIFNRQGYAGSSLTDIMRETGLEKGGIYNHFSSKEQLGLEAFDYAYRLVTQRVRKALAGKFNAFERLVALVGVFDGIVEDPPVFGGCPILNAAIEADDSNEGLRDRARSAMDEWRDTFRRIITKGMARQELRPGLDADEIASILISTLEGAVMLSNLYKDSIHIKRASAHVIRYLETLLPDA
ncbi:MAG TPA: TetR/AcrR family transcriptional regulator [Ktedonobacteraceae bacterium]|nr:TetR/AcrR family transcriptional regulator [Ktedonobacteraceae bacterium]